MAGRGLTEIAANGETILYNGGSLPARYLKLTMAELEQPLRASGLIAPATWQAAIALFDNAAFWSWQNCYVTTAGRKPAG
jgi:hypothetical protein